MIRNFTFYVLHARVAHFNVISIKLSYGDGMTLGNVCPLTLRNHVRYFKVYS